jgi:hypothetical protein
MKVRVRLARVFSRAIYDSVSVQRVRIKLGAALMLEVMGLLTLIVVLTAMEAVVPAGCLVSYDASIESITADQKFPIRLLPKERKV